MVGVGLRIEVVSSVSGKEEGPKSKLQTAKGTKATRLERRIDKTPGIHQLAAPFCSTPAALSGGAVCRSSPQSTKIPHVPTFSTQWSATSNYCTLRYTCPRCVCECGARATCSFDCEWSAAARQPGRRELRLLWNLELQHIGNRCGALKTKNTEYKDLTNPAGQRRNSAHAAFSYPASKIPGDWEGLHRTRHAQKGPAAAVNYRLAKRRRGRTSEGNGERHRSHMMGWPVDTW